MLNPRGSNISNRSRKSSHSNQPPQVVQSYRNYQYCSQDQIDNEQPIFQTKNYLFQLQSRINNLEYENTKNAMIHENIVNELSSKNEYLQQVAGNLSQQNQGLMEERENLKDLLNDVREQNFVFSKEISSLRIELNSIASNPHQISTSQFNEDNLKKDETIAALQKELSSITSSMQGSEKQRQRLKIELQELRSQNQVLNKQIRSKQKEYQEQKIRLLSQIEELKSQFEIRNKKTNYGSSTEVTRLTELVQSKDQHLKTLQNDRATLQNKLNESLLDIGRLRCQKTNLEQYNAYLQITSKQNQDKRKNLQQQVFKNQRQISELRSQLFNQRLENKKLINNLKLQFEEEKIRYVEQVEQKAKELSKLRQYSCQSNRQVIDMEELSDKNNGILTDLEKANQQVSQLKKQNAKIKNDLQTCQDKLEKKHEKLCTLESKMKGQKDQRLKALQNEIYSLQQINNQLEVKLQLAQGKSPKQLPQKSQNNNFFDLLKSELKQQKQRVKQLQNKQRQFNEQRSNLYDQISKLEGELRMARDLRNTTLSNDSKVGTIELLQQQVENLNQEVQEERSKLEQKRKQANMQKEQLLDEINKLEREQQRMNIQNSRMSQRMTNLEEQLKHKDSEIADLEDQTKELKRRKQHYEQYTKVNLLEEAKHDINVKELQQKYINLQRQNITLKQEYSKSLQQINTILVKYQAAEEKYSKLVKKDNGKPIEQQKNRIAQLEQQCQRLRKVINHQQEEQRRLLKIISQLQYQQNNRGRSRQGSARKYSTDTLWLNSKDQPSNDRNHNNRTHRGYPIHRI